MSIYVCIFLGVNHCIWESGHERVILYFKHQLGIDGNFNKCIWLYQLKRYILKWKHFNKIAVIWHLLFYCLNLFKILHYINLFSTTRPFWQNSSSRHICLVITQLLSPALFWWKIHANALFLLSKLTRENLIWENWCWLQNVNQNSRNSPQFYADKGVILIPMGSLCIPSV